MSGIKALLHIEDRFVRLREMIARTRTSIDRSSAEPETKRIFFSFFDRLLGELVGIETAPEAVRREHLLWDGRQLIKALDVVNHEISSFYQRPKLAPPIASCNAYHHFDSDCGIWQQRCLDLVRAEVE